MKIDNLYRTYYHSLYDSLDLLYRRIFKKHSPIVIQWEKQWSSKIIHVLDEERGALERCEEESMIRRSRVSWLEKMKADELFDRNLWRTGLEPLPIWRRKGKKHAAKRHGSNLPPESGKKRKVGKEPDKTNSPRRRVRLLSDSVESENYRNMVCGSEDEG